MLWVEGFAGLVIFADCLMQFQPQVDGGWPVSEDARGKEGPSCTGIVRTGALLLVVGFTGSLVRLDLISVYCYVSWATIYQLKRLPGSE